MSRIADILKINTVQLQRLINTGGVKKVRAAYERARADLETSLADLARKGKGQSFTAHHMRITLVQVNQSLNAFAAEMGDVLSGHSLKAGELAHKHQINTIKALEKHFTGHAPALAVEESGVFHDIYKGVKPSLLNRYKKSEAFYTRPVILKIRNELSQSLLTGQTVDQAVDRVAGVDGVFANERWRAERIVRTEMSHAYSTVKQRSMEETAKEMPGLMKKLIATFDNRTGEDSKELHGQIQPVDQPFIWSVKNSKGQPTGEVIEYMNPPNRPNDREVAISWRLEWTESAVTKPVAPTA